MISKGNVLLRVNPQTRVLAHPFITSSDLHLKFKIDLYTYHAAAAVFINPFPAVAGVRFVDARSASRMYLGVNIVGRFST